MEAFSKTNWNWMHFLFTVDDKYNFIINTLINVIDFTIPNIKVNEYKIRYLAETKELVNKKNNYIISVKLILKIIN